MGKKTRVGFSMMNSDLLTPDEAAKRFEQLGGKLMLNFIKTLKEMGALWRMVFVNEGVKLTVDGAETIEALRELEESGVSMLVCGTCLEYFGILEDKRIGETTNMLDIVTSLQVSEKIINI